MACYHPLRGVVLGYTENGKKNIKIIPNSDFSFEVPGIEYINIPCGKCIGCRLDYSRQWADRCMMEAQYHEHNSFITLTYNDENLPDFNPKFDTDTGEFIGYSSIHPLVKKDFQDFMKRLRDRVGYDTPIRYYACGEYGGRSLRPHYHAILFGYDFSDDRKLLKRNFQNNNYYVSELLDSCWKKGYSMIANVDWHSCAYVSRYVAKKIFKENDLYYKENVPNEFTVMSRKPGIGRQYYEDNKLDILKNQRIYISDSKGSKEIRPPKYYDRLFDIEYPQEMEEIRNKRSSISKNNVKIKLEHTSKDFLGMLEDAEVNLEARTKILKERSKIDETFG